MIRKLLIKKNSGNIPSIIYGQIFMMLIIIWAMFQFRLIMLNTTFEYIDDALTTSLLGGALINTEEYGKSNQVIAHNNDVYSKVDPSPASNGWATDEAMILVSQLNYNSDIILKPDELPDKTKLNTTFRTEKTYNTLDNKGNSFPIPQEVGWENDYYLKRVVSTFSDNMNYNLSNGVVQNGKNPLEFSSGNTIPGLNNGIDHIFSIKDALLNSFLSRYLSDEIKVIRFETYNVYRRNLARRVVYYSNFLTYNSNYLNTYYTDADKLESVNYMTPSQIKWGNNEPKTEDEFRRVYEPCKYQFKDDTTAKKYKIKTYQNSTLSDNRKLDRITGTTGFINDLPNSYYAVDASGKKKLNSNYAKEWETYLRMRARWRADRAFWTAYSTKPYFYLDTESTYQGPADLTSARKIPIYKYFFVDSDTKDDVMNSGNQVINGEKAPISGYGHWIYTNTYKGPDNVTVGVTNSQNYTYTPTNAKPTVKYNGKDRALENTSFLAEIAFSIKVFPTLQNNGSFLLDNLGYKTVSVERLVDISAN